MKKKISILMLVISMFSCGNEFSEKEKAEYTARGKEIAQTTFKKLSSELITQMKEGGPAQAIPFCNLQAVPLVNELSKTHKVSIKRTTNQLRSSNNKPLKRELKIIRQFQEKLKLKSKIKPLVEKEAGKIHFYAPIKIQAKCLICHGKKGETLTAETDSIIKLVYPNDLATGYSEGDLRGIWSITFNE